MRNAEIFDVWVVLFAESVQAYHSIAPTTKAWWGLY
jgi:hypothetical protein